MSKTYFYENDRGVVFACEAREAYHAHKKYKQWGVSDGETFKRIYAEVEPKTKLLDTTIERLLRQIEVIQEKVIAAESEDAEDRLNERLDKLQERYEAAAQEKANLIKDAATRAEQAEREAAMGHLEDPPDLEKVDINGNPVNFSSLKAT